MIVKTDGSFAALVLSTGQQQGDFYPKKYISYKGWLSAKGGGCPAPPRDLILILDSLDTRKIIYPGDAPRLGLARPDTGRGAVSATARLARQGAGSSWLM